MRKAIFLRHLAIIILLLTTSYLANAQALKSPVMGWSSWNNFRINIDETLIREQADAMVSSGLYDAGYRYVNIDDGYFGGRAKDGKLFSDQDKFPSGMKALADYIHSKNLKAGIYTDAGKNTCGSIWDKDPKGFGVGIFGHVEQDCDLFFKDWGYDFLKVDWCGGERMKLDEKTEYLNIIKFVKAISPDNVFNICRWEFPGEWAIKKADSWRISGDIAAEFTSILAIIDLNADLYKYSSPGHYNDMDMLQVGRGMSFDEDKTHFSMWCMMNSPLLAGNDLRKMSKQTIDILTNKEVIALNQDQSYKQAQRVLKEGEVEVWIKYSIKDNAPKSIAIMNRGNNKKSFTLTPDKLHLNKKINLRDLWLHKNLGKLKSGKAFVIPTHGVVLLNII